ncbi:hypothetical protein GCM10023238_00890 [Streptomyces heliomycini]
MREHPLDRRGVEELPEYRDGHATLALSSGSDIAGAGSEYHKQALLSPHSMYLLVLKRAEA